MTTRLDDSMLVSVLEVVYLAFFHKKVIVMVMVMVVVMKDFEYCRE